MQEAPADLTRLGQRQLGITLPTPTEIYDPDTTLRWLGYSGEVSLYDPADCPARRKAMTEVDVAMSVGTVIRMRSINPVEFALKTHVTVDAWSATPLSTKSVMEKLTTLDLCFSAWTAKDREGFWLFPQYHSERQRRQMFEHWGNTYGELGFCRDGSTSTDPRFASLPWIVACQDADDAVPKAGPVTQVVLA